MPPPSNNIRERQLERGVFTHTTQHYKQKHTRVTRVSRDRELHRSGATHDRGVRGDEDGRHAE